LKATTYPVLSSELVFALLHRWSGVKASRGAIWIRKLLCETKVSELVHDGYCSHFDILNSKKKNSSGSSLVFNRMP